MSFLGKPDMTKKSWKNTKAQRAGGRSNRGSRLRPDRGLGLAIQPGHSNSERMLMRLLWSLWCFPCFQHLQGPHGARSIKTTKWEIWTFFCDAGGLFAFQPGCPFSVPPRKEKIRKKLLQGVWMSKLFRKMAYLRTWSNNQFMATQGRSLWRRKNHGLRRLKRTDEKEKGDAQIWRLFLTTTIMRSLTSWAGLHYSRRTTGSQMKGEWAWVPAGWFRSTLIAQRPMKGSWAVAHISGKAHCLIGWCLLAFVMRWLRASLSPSPVERKALESTLLGLLSESMQ